MFNERLRELRMARGVSQKNFAAEMRLSPERYNQYETGRREPDYQMLTQFADYFSVTTDYLLGKSDTPNPPTVADDIEDDEFEGLEFGFFTDYKELSEEHKRTLRAMAKVLKQMNESPDE